MDTPSIVSVLTKTQRLILGLLVLLLVDIIWVSSSELTKVNISQDMLWRKKNQLDLFQYLYHNETFQKPFFCTYVKTSMFMLYLLGFLFSPWRDECTRPSNYMVS